MKFGTKMNEMIARDGIDTVADRTVDYAIEAALNAIVARLGLPSPTSCGDRAAVLAAEEALNVVVRKFVSKYSTM